MLLFFPLILNYSVRSLYSHSNSYNDAAKQCHVDAAQRAWATCAACYAFCSVFCLVLFSSPPRSFCRLKHVVKVRIRCSYSRFSSLWQYFWNVLNETSAYVRVFRLLWATVATFLSQAMT